MAAPRVLVVGASGALGRPVVHLLRERGVPVRALFAAAKAAGVERFVCVSAHGAAPLHPGLARVLRLSALPDDACSERFDGAAALEREHGITLTTLEQFVRERVAESRARG